MTLTQVWGALAIVILCPLLGGLPLISWITYALTRRKLRQIGTGNISVSAAFYHGGKLAGLLAVLSEALKGIAAVLLAREFFPFEPVWEIVALIALVMGRYWMGKGAGTTNVVWGIAVHDPITAALVFLIGGISFTIFRDRTTGRISSLVLFVIILSLRHPQDSERIIAAVILACLLAWIYAKIPDDLDLSATAGKPESQTMFRFFRGDSSVTSLDSKLDPHKVGQKAANLAKLKRQGYSVPDGWVIPAGDDPQPLIEWLDPTPEQPLVVRSSAIGEDSESASAAGQYTTILNVISPETLQTAIYDCLASYDDPAAVQYRRDRHLSDSSMAVIIQKQVRGVFSGVAFSRDPIEQLNNAVVIEALPGDASQVVSGQVTPYQYQVEVQKVDDDREYSVRNWDENIPAELLKSVAQLAREIEDLYLGIPQDLEWTYDGEQLWLLQARPITNLQPIWTRKIAAEVIPGIIRPLTWSINRPLTCGVWGEIFTVVLGERATDLDFEQTATLHYSRAYFNATLLGDIFRRMGLPAESLEFLTRGAKMSRPPLQSTLKNLPGLFRLLKREWQLEQDFDADQDRYFAPTLDDLQERSPGDLPPEALLQRIETILSVLEKATYYSILAPLSLALRQAVLQVDAAELDNSRTPEVASMRSLSRLATDARNLLPREQLTAPSCASLFAHLAEIPDGESVLEQFGQWLERYGYLSEVATDIAVPRWRENPRPVREIFTQYLFEKPEDAEIQAPKSSPNGNWRKNSVQKRLDLKGKVTEIYSRLLAHLRWSFIALANQWQESGLLSQTQAIFWLEFAEIRHYIEETDPSLAQLSELVEQRQTQFQQDQELPNAPYLVYGNPSPAVFSSQNLPSSQQLQGIGASPGKIEGKVKILHNFTGTADITPQTILVVPYTDSGWSPLLARAGGLIAEVGGRLSHGAIVAREYGIPAVMDIEHATRLLQDGQQVRLDGQKGTVEILD